ncbi:MAG: HupE/UreJ family protein [Bacteroidia bacterium]|nr:HupE/UreJ family protein [Bacteroidia bacterium]
MHPFWVYLQLGLGHITDLGGYDHMVFLLALTAVHTYREWARLLWLVTAFTVGHSLTLALATLKLVSISPALIEFLIPVTILCTALAGLFTPTPDPRARPRPGQQARRAALGYLLALVFGLIHGLGFANYLQALLGKASVTLPLLAFNLGVELGQLAIVAAIVAVGYLLLAIFGVKRREWQLIQCAVAATLATQLMVQTYPVA